MSRAQICQLGSSCLPPSSPVDTKARVKLGLCMRSPIATSRLSGHSPLKSDMIDDVDTFVKSRRTPMTEGVSIATAPPSEPNEDVLKATVPPRTDENGEIEEDEEEGEATGGAKSKAKKKKRKKGKGATNAEDGAYVPAEVQCNLRVVRLEGKGRCAVTSRDVKAGELLFEEEPLALVVFRQHAGSLCHMCGRASPRRFFEGVPYCRDECLARHGDVWKLAKQALLAVDDIAREADTDADLLRMVTLLICKRHVLLERDAAAGTTSGAQQWRNLTGLMDHQDAMTPAFLASVRKGVSRVLACVAEEARISEDEAVRLACIINVNSHGANLCSSFNTTAGFGLFPLLAILNHSCRPNAAFVFLEGTMRVRVLEDLPAGSELTVPYINLLQSRSLRQKELLDTKHFTCTCVRCSKESPADVLLGAVCCLSCGERGVVGPARGRGDTIGDDAWADEGAAGTGGGKGGKKKKKAAAASAGDEALSNGVAKLSLADSANGADSAKAGAEGGLQCSACGAAFSQADVDAYVEHVAQAKEAIGVLMQGRAYEKVKDGYERLLALHDASVPAKASAAVGRSVARLSGHAAKLRLHPNHQLLLECLPTLVNCCNNLQDFSSAAVYLRRMLSLMVTVYPPSFPELADYHCALAGALHNHARPRSLPRKSAIALRNEIKGCFQKAYEIRRVAMGEDHPLTIEAKEHMEAANGLVA